MGGGMGRSKNGKIKHNYTGMGNVIMIILYKMSLYDDAKREI